MNVIVYQPGMIGYQPAAELQRRLAAAVADGRHPPALLLLEHPHVYTLGRQSEMKDLLWDAKTMAKRGIQVAESDRGGRITYHGPGQLIGYPILPLGATGTLEYLRKLEETLIQTLAGLQITGVRIPGQTGVWIPGCESPSLPAKIASIGVRVDANRVTRHGFALNISPQMDFWDGIIACGLDNQRQVSISNLQPDPPEMNTIIAYLLTAFANVFGYRITSGETLPPPGELFDTPLKSL